MTASLFVLALWAGACMWGRYNNKQRPQESHTITPPFQKHTCWEQKQSESTIVVSGILVRLKPGSDHDESQFRLLSISLDKKFRATEEDIKELREATRVLRGLEGKVRFCKWCEVNNKLRSTIKELLSPYYNEKVTAKLDSIDYIRVLEDQGYTLAEIFCHPGLADGNGSRRIFYHNISVKQAIEHQIWSIGQTLRYLSLKIKRGELRLGEPWDVEESALEDK